MALSELANNLRAPNAVHLWREADFTLMFHASIENDPVALQLLLDKGADPRKANNRGTNALMLMMKRSQLEMSEMCMSKLPNDSERKAFVNSTTEPGWTSLMLAQTNTSWRPTENSERTCNSRMSLSTKRSWTCCQSIPEYGLFITQAAQQTMQC